MKSLQLALCGFALLLLTACNSIENSPLELSLELTEHEAYSIEGISGRIILTNQSDSALLVNRRLFCIPQPVPPNAAEVLILVSDPDGKLVNSLTEFRYDLPNEEMLSVLSPGEKHAVGFRLAIFFGDSGFKQGQPYTIVVIYQNDIEATQTIGGVEVPSWVGSIRSNEETFVILP